VQDQNDSALTIGTYRALAGTFYYLGDFESARQYAMRGVRIWRSGGLPSLVEEPITPAIACLFYEALLEWHFAETTSCHATMAEAISLAMELNNMHALAHALWHAGILAHLERNPAEAERLASEVINCQLVRILHLCCAEQPFSEVGRGALPATQLKAFRGSRTELKIIGRLARSGPCHICLH
jgi:hypothetical protein